MVSGICKVKMFFPLCLTRISTKKRVHLLALTFKANMAVLSNRTLDRFLHNMSGLVVSTFTKFSSKHWTVTTMPLNNYTFFLKIEGENESQIPTRFKRVFGTQAYKFHKLLLAFFSSLLPIHWIMLINI